jgi:hypothetical protein
MRFGKSGHGLLATVLSMVCALVLFFLLGAGRRDNSSDLGKFGVFILVRIYCRPEQSAAWAHQIGLLPDVPNGSMGGCLQSERLKLV